MASQSAIFRSASGSPAAFTASRPFSPSSQAKTEAPPASKERPAASPDSPIPKTATVLPAKECASIMLPQLQRGQPNKGENHGNDPETHNNGRLGPALLLEMVVQRRHSEHALARQFER